MTPIYKVWEALTEKLPTALQESYDNCGLQVGDPSQIATGVLCCVDITEAVLQEAITKGCNMIIAHHPLLFKRLKQIGTSSYIERCVRLAIRHDLTIYAAHTNADNADGGLNYLLAEELGLESVTNVRHAHGAGDLRPNKGAEPSGRSTLGCRCRHDRGIRQL